MQTDLQNGCSPRSFRPTRATAGLFIGAAVLASLWAYAAASYWLEPNPVTVACAHTDFRDCVR